MNCDVPIAKYCPKGPFGVHLGFLMKIDDQHKFGTRHHTETNNPIQILGQEESIGRVIFIMQTS